MEERFFKESKINDIEVLRAVAVSFTLVGHISGLLYWNSPWITWFGQSLWAGVDLFFCISGFVIARSLLFSEKLKMNNNTHFFLEFAIPFWIKRIFRIWPIAFLWLFIILFLTISFNKSGAFGLWRNNFGDTIAALLQVANFHFFNCHTSNAICGVNGIYWSLSLEEQFYLAFPFLLFFLPRRFLIPTLLIGISMQFPIRRPPDWNLFWAIRTDALMLGVLIAVSHSTSIRRYLEPTFLAGYYTPYLTIGVGILFLATLGSELSIVSFTTGLIAVISAILVFIASFDKGYILPSGYLKKCLLYIGSRSFALYIVHMPAYFITREIYFRLFHGIAFNGTWTLRFLAIGIPLLFVLAELTYHFVEMPFRLYGRHLANIWALQILNKTSDMQESRQFFARDMGHIIEDNEIIQRN